MIIIKQNKEKEKVAVHLNNVALKKKITLRCMVTELCLTLCNPSECGWPGSSVHGIFPGKNSGVEFFPPGDLPNPGIEPTSSMSPRLQANYVPTEPWERPLTLRKR